MPSNWFNEFTGGPSDYGMLCMRLGVHRGNLYGGDVGKATPFNNIEFMEVHRPAAGDVIVFIVKKSEPITLRDNSDLFPSDGLITQIRLLMED